MISSPRTYCWWNVVPEPTPWAQVLLLHSNNSSNQKCKYFPQETKRAIVYILKMNFKKQNILSISKIPICIVNPNLKKKQILKKKLGKKKEKFYNDFLIMSSWPSKYNYWTDVKDNTTQQWCERDFFFFWVAERQREKSKEKAEGKCHADC